MIDPAGLAAALRASCLFESPPSLPSGTEQGQHVMANSVTPSFPQMNHFQMLGSTSSQMLGRPQQKLHPAPIDPNNPSSPPNNTSAAAVVSSLMAANNPNTGGCGVPAGMYMDQQLQQQVSSLSDMLRQNFMTSHMPPPAPVCSSIGTSISGNMTPKLNCGMTPFGMATDASSNSTRHPRFYKTKICPYLQQKGKCSKGYKCVYAHSLVELRGLPNLEKTKLCPSYKSDGTCMTPRCPFAHTIEELRHTDNFYKTKLCHMWKKGKCFAGTLCRHAHGPEELNWFRAVARQTSQGSSPASAAMPTPNLHGSEAYVMGGAFHPDKLLNPPGYDQTQMYSHAMNPLYQIIQQIQSDQKQTPVYPLLCHLQNQAIAPPSAESQLMHLLRYGAPQQHDPAMGSTIHPSMDQQQMDATQAAFALFNLSGLYQQVALSLPDGSSTASQPQLAGNVRGLPSEASSTSLLPQNQPQAATLLAAPAVLSTPALPQSNMASSISEGTRCVSSNTAASPVVSNVKNENEELDACNDECNDGDLRSLSIGVVRKVAPATSGSTEETAASIPGSPMEQHDKSLGSDEANSVANNRKHRVADSTEPSEADSGSGDDSYAATAAALPLAAPAEQTEQHVCEQSVQPHRVSDAARCLQVTQLIKALQDQLPLLLQYNPYADPNNLATLLAAHHQQQHQHLYHSDLCGGGPSDDPSFSTTVASSSLSLELQQQEDHLHNHSVL